MNTFSGLNVSNALLFDALGKSTLLLAPAFGLALVLRRAPAAYRNLLWRLTFGALVYTTFVSLFLPALHSVGFSAVPTDIPINALTQHYQAVLNRPIQHPPIVTGSPSDYVAQSFRIRTPEAFPLGLMYKPRVTLSNTGNAFFTGNALYMRQEQAAWMLGGVWLLGFGVAFARFARRGHAARTLERHSLPLDAPAVQDALACVGQRLGLERLPTLRTQFPSSGLFSPLTWGRAQTYVLLPHDAPSWTTEKLEAVLLHELAHIRRGDWIAQRLAELVCALVWFHPLAWLAARQMRDSAEQACDDIALTHGIAPTIYARELLAIARALHTPCLPSGAALPFTRSLRLETRLKAVLDDSAHRHAPSPRNARRVALVAALLLLPLALLFPVTTHSLLLTPSAQNAVRDARLPAAEKPVTAINNKATFSDGATIELIGVTAGKTRAGSKQENWWGPDGLPLKDPPALSRLYLYHQAKMLRIANRGMTLVTHGVDPADASIGVEYTPTSIVSSLEPTTSAQPNATMARYDSIAGFSDTKRECAMRVKMARGKWRVTASAHTLSTTRATTDGTTVTFAPPDKEWMRSLTVAERRSGVGQAAVLIRSKTPIVDMARRLVLISDKGQSIPVDSDYAILYIHAHGHKDEYDIGALVPRQLRGHIKEYQLQTRPYQYIDFPNINLEPKLH